LNDGPGLATALLGPSFDFAQDELRSVLLSKHQDECNPSG
jgi:hypothetical protein